MGVLGGEPLCALLLLKQGCHLVRNLHQLPDQFPAAGFVDFSVNPCKLYCQDVCYNELGAVGFRRGNCYLRTRMRVKHKLGLPGNGTSEHIDNGQCVRSLACGLPEGGKAVSRLS